jgi:serine/threonine protein kinase
LHNHRIAHRDLKPDNILFRIPANIKPLHAMVNIALDGITAVICDFGEAYDFAVDDMKAMIIESVLTGVSPGGAVAYLAPEIRNTQSGKKSSLNYDRAEIEL